MNDTHDNAQTDKAMLEKMTKYEYTIVPVDGPVVYESGPKKLSLEEMQKIVGGYIELVQDLNGRDMLVDEDGISKELPFNLEASMRSRHRIYGTALILDYRMD